MAAHDREAREPIKKPDEDLSPQSGRTLVDPRPTAPEIKLGDAEYKFPPAEASPPEVLALEPNTYEDAVNGPDEQVSMVDYTVWNKPDNSSFLAPIANDATYERKGYVRGANKEIPDLVAYLGDQAKTDKQRETEKRGREAVEQRDQQRREALKVTDRQAPKTEAKAEAHASR